MNNNKNKKKKKNENKNEKEKKNFKKIAAALLLLLLLFAAKATSIFPQPVDLSFNNASAEGIFEELEEDAVPLAKPVAQAQADQTQVQAALVLLSTIQEAQDAANTAEDNAAQDAKEFADAVETAQGVVAAAETEVSDAQENLSIASENLAQAQDVLDQLR